MTAPLMERCHPYLTLYEYKVYLNHRHFFTGVVLYKNKEPYSSLPFRSTIHYESKQAHILARIPSKTMAEMIMRSKARLADRRALLLE